MYFPKQANPDCNIFHEETPIERLSLRRRSQVDYKEKDESMIKLVQRVDEIVSYRNLSLESATVTDFAHVYGRRTFFVPSGKKTIFSLQDRIA